MHCLRAILFLCLLLTTAVGAAQQYNIRSWTLEQGLPQSQVMAIQQDHEGFLWLATRAGLSRFNGTDFTTYTKEEGLSSHNISTLFLDSRHRLWVGTTDAGLLLFNGVSFQPYGQEQGVGAKAVRGITEDKAGKLWLATDNGVYSLAREGMLKYASLPDLNYTAVTATPTGELWAGTADNGLYRVKGSQTTHFTAGNSELPSNHITALSVSKSHEVWIGTAKGLAQAEQTTLSRVQLPQHLDSSRITSFTSDHYNNLWVGLQRNGLLKYNGDSFTHITRNGGLRTNRITALSTDKEGNVWIGTNGYGLQQHMAPWFVHFFEFPNLTEPRVTAIAQDRNGTLWLGTDEGELAKMEQHNLTWLSRKPWPQGTTVYSFLPTPEALWACTSNGVWRLAQQTTTHYSTAEGLPSLDVYQATAGPDGQLYLATGGGVAVLQGSTFRLLPSPEGTLKANSILRDSKGRIWAGGDKGIFRVERGQVVQPPELQGLHLTEVRSITEDKKGVLYFAAFNTGILMLQGTKATLVTAAEGLPSEAVKSVYADSADNLWVATSRNVLKARLPALRQEGAFNHRSYSGPSGFRGMEVCDNAMLQTQEAVWFGTTKGLTKYLPGLDRRNKVPPRLTLTEVLLYSRPTDWEALGYAYDSLTGLPVNLRLPHTQNHLAFNFQGICLSAPEQVKYKYRLVGYEDAWSPVTSRSFSTYANLSPGTYTFELMGQNNDGYWTPQPLTYTFSIVPPIWRREWFIGVLLVVIAGTILSVVRLRERSLVKMNSLLELKVNHRTRLLERQNREKEILLQEIHHRVKNNLQIVISLLNLQARHVEDPSAQEVMKALRSRVRSMSLLHERLYQHSNLEHINLEDYFIEICESLYASYGVSMDRIALELDVPDIKVDVDSAITLGLIVNELVSNTLKYAFQEGEHGVLRIELIRHDEVQYTLTVSDNGRGLPEDFFLKQQKGQSFGLKLVQSLSKKLEGNIRFYNNNGDRKSVV